MGDTAKLLAPRPDELPLAVEYHHCVGAFAIAMDRVMDVDVVLRILHHAMRVAPFEARRQLSPVVNGFVLPLAFAKHRGLGARFILSVQNHGRSRSRGEKRSPCCHPNPSEAQPKAELNTPWRVHLRQGHDTELAGRRASGRGVEPRRVELVECLGAELRAEALAD